MITFIVAGQMTEMDSCVIIFGRFRSYDPDGTSFLGNLYHCRSDDLDDALSRANLRHFRSDDVDGELSLDDLYRVPSPEVAERAGGDEGLPGRHPTLRLHAGTHPSQPAAYRGD